MNRNEILVIHIITKLYLGGAQKVSFEILKYLKSNGYNVLIITGPKDELTETVASSGIPIETVKNMQRRLNLLKDVLSIAEIVIILKLMKKKYKKIIVHTHTSKSGLLGRIAARMVGIDAVYHTAHGWSFFNGQNIVLYRIYALSEYIASLFTDKIIGVSKSVIKEGMKIGIKKNKFLLIYNGVEILKRIGSKESTLLREKYNIEDSEKIILQVSCLKKQKSPMDFIKIAEKFKDCDYRFILAGDGELRDEIESYIESKNISNVILTGWYKNVNELYSISDIFTLTSLFEGYPLVLLEYSQFGKPIICTNIEPNLELLKQNGLFCPVHDIGCYAQNIKRSIGLNNKISLHLKSFEKMSTEYEEFYREKFRKMQKE